MPLGGFENGCGAIVVHMVVMHRREKQDATETEGIDVAGEPFPDAFLPGLHTNAEEKTSGKALSATATAFLFPRKRCYEDGVPYTAASSRPTHSRAC